ncbi:MAG: tRNA (adenosine(37)-N6)-threonylcarbamoyltransferase complex dimerization subunit type 1 TsaB [Thiotrichales bacterium]
MKLLALDTSTEACTAALWLDGEILERFEYAPRGHAGLILPMFDALLAEAGVRLGELDAIAFGRGPGSFTGVRIGTAVAQGAALAADLPLAPVSTLAALAQHAANITGASRIASAIDARMGEIYAAYYRRGDDGLCVLDGVERVCRAAEWTPPTIDVWLGAGTGWATYGECLVAAFGPCLQRTLPDCLPHAGALAMLGAAMVARGETIAPDLAQPVYLRDQVTHQSRAEEKKAP